MATRVRTIIGLLGSLLIMLSSLAHSFAGWPAQRAVLQSARVPAETILGLSIGWYFGGLAIAVFGLIAVISFVQVLRGHTPHMRATMIIGLAYIGFGVWAWFVTREPFPLVFIVPGLLVLTGATARPSN